jgi:hypothetical protein
VLLRSCETRNKKKRCTVIVSNYGQLNGDETHEDRSDDLRPGLIGSQALAQEQTRIYGPDGRSLGTASPYGTGSVRYRDSRGRTTFTTTTMNGVTRFYDSGGHLTGTVIGSRRR